MRSIDSYSLMQGLWGKFLTAPFRSKLWPPISQPKFHFSVDGQRKRVLRERTAWEGPAVLDCCAAWDLLPLDHVLTYTGIPSMEMLEYRYI